ncbi:MAG: GNAT family N-acetyltransferase [Vicinamibacteria bacterium]
MTTIARVTTAEVAPLLPAMAADGLDVLAGEGIWLAARDDAGGIDGLLRLFERAGHHVLDDLWVAPARRGRGIGGALIARVRAMRRPLWLIADEADVTFYAARGFAAVADDSFPAPLAAHYAAKDEWPAPDHRHVAMRSV